MWLPAFYFSKLVREHMDKVISLYLFALFKRGRKEDKRKSFKDPLVRTPTISLIHCRMRTVWGKGAQRRTAQSIRNHTSQILPFMPVSSAVVPHEPL